MPHNFEESSYGFKTKMQRILLSEIGTIVKSKKRANDTEQFLNDKDYYDDNVQIDNLILRNLKSEAKESVDFVI